MKSMSVAKIVDFFFGCEYSPQAENIFKWSCEKLDLFFPCGFLKKSLKKEGFVFVTQGDFSQSLQGNRSRLLKNLTRQAKEQSWNFRKHGSNSSDLHQWLFLVPLKGGRDYIIPQLAVYTTYIPLIYCLLGGPICYRSHLLGEPVQQPLTTGCNGKTSLHGSVRIRCSGCCTVPGYPFGGAICIFLGGTTGSIGSVKVILKKFKKLSTSMRWP